MLHFLLFKLIDKLISKVFLRTPTHGHSSFGWLALCRHKIQSRKPARRDARQERVRNFFVAALTMIQVAFNYFQTFFVQTFKIVINFWKFSMLLVYILWDDWPIFMISRSNEQLQQLLEHTLLKPDCYSWWISKRQSGHEDTLEERYAIKFCFKLGKNATETYGMLQTAFWPSCMNRASVFEWHKRFKKSRESVRDDERCGRSKEVRIPELIGQIKNFMDKDHRVYSTEPCCPV